MTGGAGLIMEAIKPVRPEQLTLELLAKARAVYAQAKVQVNTQKPSMRQTFLEEVQAY